MKDKLSTLDAFIDYWRTPIIQEMDRGEQIRCVVFLILSVSATTLVIDLISGIPASILLLFGQALIKATVYTLGMIASEVLITYFSKRDNPYSGISVGKIWVISLVGFIIGYALLAPLRSNLGHLEHHGSESDLLFFLKITPVWAFITYLFVQYHLGRSLQAEVTQLQEVNASLEKRPLISSENEPAMTLLDNDQETAIEIPGKKGLRLDATAVSFVRVVEHYCYIHHWNQGQLNSLEVKLPLKEIQVLLPVQMFIQVHRSYLINLSHITRLKKVTRSYELFLRATEESIPISRYRLSEVLPRLQPFLSGK